MSIVLEKSYQKEARRHHRRHLPLIRHPRRLQPLNILLMLETKSHRRRHPKRIPFLLKN